MFELNVISFAEIVGPFGLDWGLYLALATVFVLAVGFFVYRDAVSRGMNGTRWFLVVVLTALLGLLLYYLLRRGHATTAS